MDVIEFFKSTVSARRNIFLYPKLCQETGQSLEESLLGGKLVKNLEIFWRNNKTINSTEFVFRLMWRIKLFSEATSAFNILLDRHNSSHHHKPYSIANYRSRTEDIEL